SENSVDLALIVALLLKGGLDVGYDLARVFTRARRVDRSVINIDRVRSITPRRVPIGTVPVIPAAVNEREVRVMPIPPPGVMPLRVIILEYNVLRAVPILRARDLVIRVVIDRLVLVNDVILVVRLQIELLLLELEVLVRVQVLVHVQVLVRVQVLRFVELGRVCAGVETSLALSLALSLPILRLLPLLTHGAVIADRVGLLEVLIVRSRGGLLIFLAGLRSDNLLLLLLLLALLFALLVVIVLIVVLSRAHERRQPHTTG